MNWSGGSKNRLRIIRNDMLPVKNSSLNLSGHLSRIPIVDKQSNIEEDGQKSRLKLESTPKVSCNTMGLKIKSCIKNSNNQMGRNEQPQVTDTPLQQPIPFASIKSGATGTQF